MVCPLLIENKQMYCKYKGSRNKKGKKKIIRIKQKLLAINKVGDGSVHLHGV